MSGSRQISRRQQEFLCALLESATIKEAAARVGVNERTAYRWRQQPEFVDAYGAAKAVIYQDAITRLQSAAGAAVTTLCNSLADRSGAVRLRAALGILQLGAELGELADISARLAKLEDRTGDETRRDT